MLALNEIFLKHRYLVWICLTSNANDLAVYSYDMPNW